MLIPPGGLANPSLTPLLPLPPTLPPDLPPLKPMEVDTQKQKTAFLERIEFCKGCIMKLMEGISKAHFAEKLPYKDVKYKFKLWEALRNEIYDECRKNTPGITDDKIEKVIGVSSISYNFHRSWFKMRSAQKRLEKSLESSPYTIEQLPSGHTFFSMKVKGEPMRFAVMLDDKPATEFFKRISLGQIDQIDNIMQIIEGKYNYDPKGAPIGIKVNDINNKQVSLSFFRDYTIEQCEQYLKKGEFAKIEYFFLNYQEQTKLSIGNSDINNSFYIMLFKENRFTTKELEELFLKCKDSFPELAKIILEHAFYFIYDSEEFAKDVLIFAIRHELFYALSSALVKLPKVPCDIKIDERFVIYLHNSIHLLEMPVIEKLLAAEVCPNTPSKRFDSKNYYQERSSLGCLVGLISNTVSTVTIYSSKGKEILDCLNLLLKHKVDVNQRANSDAFTEYNCSVLEYCYYNRQKSPELFETIVLILLNGKAIISPRLASVMIIDMKGVRNSFVNVHQNHLYFKHLAAQGYLNPQDEEYWTTANFQNFNARDLNSLIAEARAFVKESQTYKPLQISQLDLTGFSEIRLLKKEMKRRIALLGKQKYLPINKTLHTEYRNLCLAYDKVVSEHFLLSELRNISQEIRQNSQKQTQPSPRLVKFYGMWAPDSSFIKTDMIDRAKANLFSGYRSEHWEHLRSRVVKIADRVKTDRYLSRHFITWAHGTPSKSLPVILKTGALMPMGELLEQKIVTFSGEICGTDKNLNKKMISGERLTASWEDGQSLYFDAISRMHTTYNYALSSRGHRPNEKQFKPELCWERATPMYVDSLLQTEKADLLTHGSWTALRVDIMRLRSTDAEADRKLSTFKDYIEEKIKTCKYAEDEEELRSILSAMTDKLGMFFTPEDLKHIHDPNPFPIVFASTTEFSAIPFENCEEEFGIHGSVKLREQLQVAFTSTEKVEELRALLAPYRIHVYDFDTAFYLEMMNMIKGSRIRKWSKTHDQQRQISLALQYNILPSYATTFPKNPTYKEGNKKVALENPFYAHAVNSHEEYLQKVKQGVLLPRAIHGPVHAIRTSIWAQLIYNIYKTNNTFKAPEKESDLYFLALAAAAHDLGRQDEGVDRWDNSSAKWLRGYLINLGYEPQEKKVISNDDVEDYVDALANKDSKDPKHSHGVQMMVHDADCLEIMRCLDNPKEFRLDELWIKSEFSGKGSELEALLSEVWEFIKLTETEAFKRQIEASFDSYGDVMRYLLGLYKTTGKFSNIYRVLKNELSAFDVVEEHPLPAAKRAKPTMVP